MTLEVWNLKNCRKPAKVENRFIIQWNRWVATDIHLDQYTCLHLTIFLPFGRGTRSQVLFSIKERYSSFIVVSHLDDLKLLQMSLDHESLKLEPKEKRLAGTVNVSDIDLKDHRQDHQLLLVSNIPI